MIFLLSRHRCPECFFVSMVVACRLRFVNLVTQLWARYRNSMVDLKSEEFRALWEPRDNPATGVWRVRRRLAAAMRLVIERLTTSDAPEEELAVVAARLEDYADRLADHPQRDRYDGFAEAAVADPAAAKKSMGGAHFDFSPLIGQSNPLAPPIVITSDEQGVRGEATFGSAYEGPPGCVHGGCIAAAFDEVLGYTQTFTGQPGMTGTLETLYRSPTPLHTPLVFRSHVESIEGRKVICRGTLHEGDRLCAEAKAIFISLREGKMAGLVDKRAMRTRAGTAAQSEPSDKDS
ncbi:MAG: hotdog domain-containing protein [Candidatus Binatia bacterium]|nr:hotdog domain-containing protein [Candidatus Binatia bacterium]